MRCLVLVALAAVAAAQQARPELAEILRRHEASLGKVAALRAGDLYLWARATSGGKQFRVTVPSKA